MSGSAERRASSVERPETQLDRITLVPAIARPASATTVGRLARRSTLAALPLILAACSWFTDFKEQPKIDPWESQADTIPMRGNPQMSVPVTGTFVAGFQVSHQPLPATIDSMSGIANPTPPSDSSLANGHKYYQINCAVCHGDRGMGDGPATKYGMPGINLTMDFTKNRTDGYIYGMMRNGRGLMPTYDRIEEMDRWDVVNYVRGLQGKLGREVPVGPVGYPGQTGDAVPGYSRTAPTRPAPFVKPTPLNTGGVGVAGGASTGAEQGAPTAPGHAPDSAAGASHSTDSSAARTPGAKQ